MSVAIEQSREAWSRATAARKTIDLDWAADDLVDGWALRPDALALVMALVREMQPRHIIEFGSGLSTRALARASSQCDRPCSISSIDHDPVFSARAAERLAADGLDGSVAFQVAPLVVRPFRGWGPIFPTYLVDPTRLASALPADLVLIDGPPAMLGGRAGTLFQVLDLCRAGTTVLLDDANRAAELEAIETWKARLKGMIDVTVLPGFERGLARIMINEAVAL